MHKTFSIKEAVSFGWHEFFKHWKFWLIASIICIGVGSSSNSFSLPKTKNDNYKDTYNKVLGDSTKNQLSGNVNTSPVNSTLPPSSTPSVQTAKMLTYLIAFSPLIILFSVALVFWSVLVYGVEAVLQMGYVRLMIDAAKGNAISYQTILSDVSIRRGVRFLILDFLYALMVGVGLILLIIPGIYFAIKYMYAPYVFIDQKTGIRDAFKISGRITKGNRFRLIGFAIVSFFIILGGLLCLFVGVIPAGIIIGLATAYIYVKLSEPEKSSIEAQPTGTI